MAIKREDNKNNNKVINPVERDELQNKIKKENETKKLKKDKRNFTILFIVLSIVILILTFLLIAFINYLSGDGFKI